MDIDGGGEGTIAQPVCVEQDQKEMQKVMCEPSQMKYSDWQA